MSMHVLVRVRMHGAVRMPVFVGVNMRVDVRVSVLLQNWSAHRIAFLL